VNRKLTLGMSSLVALGIVVLALQHGLRTTDGTAAAVPKDAQPAPSVDSSVDELSPPAPDVVERMLPAATRVSIPPADPERARRAKLLELRRALLAQAELDLHARLPGE
jgi:hypothetical protein